MSAAWASAPEAKIATALSKKRLAEFGATAPTSYAASCRSLTCRIEAAYADEDAAELSKHIMLGEIALQLPTATTYVTNAPDGSQRMLVYATNPPKRR